MNYFTLSDLEKKINERTTIFVRVDTNTTLKEGKFLPNERIRCAAATINHLAAMGAKIVIGAHNGRSGDPSYVSLGPLADMLRVLIANELVYIGNSYAGDKIIDQAIQSINSLMPRKAFLLENLRFMAGETEELSSEEHSKSPFIRQLIEDCNIQYFVNDGFSVSHRSHRSVVGFMDIPNIAGLTMDMELRSAEKVFEHFSDKVNRKLNIYLLGGVKAQDYFELIEKSLIQKKVDKILTAGAFGNLCLFAQGFDIGEASKRFLEKKGLWNYYERIKELIQKHPNVFIMPDDVAFLVNDQRKEYRVNEIPEDVKKEYQAWDIGDLTISKYGNFFKDGKLIFIKGPVGAFDKSHQMDRGSRILLNDLTSPEVTKSFSVVAGGDTSEMLDAFAINKNEIKHLSLGGGSLLKFYAGAKLPGVVALEESYRKFKAKL